MKRLLLTVGLCVTLSSEAALFPNAFTTNATGPALGFAFPAALTNLDTRPITLNNYPFIVSPPSVFGNLNFGGNLGVGIYNFSDLMVFKGQGYSFNGKDNAFAYGTVDSATGAWKLGGPGNNNNYFNAPYAAMSAGMMTNINPPYDAVAHLYPVPILALNSFSDMGCTPNGPWSTNMIALVDTVAPGWFNMGWSNIWYDCGQLTNRVGAANHITNNGAAFPQGITGIVTYAHSHGFNIGAYLAHAQTYCAGSPGIPTIDSFIFQDVYDVGAMGFDFLKVDYCGNSTPYTDGLPYDPGNSTMLVRHYAMFPEANYFMSYKLGRKPLYMETTEVFSSVNNAWHPDNTLAGFNAYENGSSPGDATWQGGLTNFIFEMVNNHETRPGHWVRQNSLTGSTAIQARGAMSLFALAPSSVFLASSNLIGNATASPFYTNSLVNFGILQHPLVLPGYEVISNSVNHTVVIARPLGPLNGIPTTASAFNGGRFATGLGGYTTFGTTGTNAVGVFNLDSGAHTQVINVNNVGMASNAPIQVIDVWGNTSQGYFTNQWTSPSIAAGDSALYLFILPPVGTNFVVYAAGTAYTLTATPALLDFGTTDPILTLQDAGTYKITGGVGLKYSAATYAGAQTVTVKLRRTSGSAADLTSGGRTVELPVLTTFTGGDFIGLPPIYYTANAGDVIQIFGSVSATPSAGSVTCDSAEITADLVRGQ